jgi:hypothetical protein
MTVKPSKVRPVLPVTIAAAVLAAGLYGAVASSRQTTVAGQPSPSTSAAPGVQPKVQQWFEKRDRPQVELNDTLALVVQKKLNPDTCRRLDRAVSAVAAVGAAPDPKVGTLAQAGLDRFKEATAACLTGDHTTSYRLVAEGLAERSAATEELDESLEGE